MWLCDIRDVEPFSGSIELQFAIWVCLGILVLVRAIDTVGTTVVDVVDALTDINGLGPPELIDDQNHVPQPQWVQNLLIFYPSGRVLRLIMIHHRICWTWSYFVGHTVRYIHLCFSVWTRIRYCYAITCCSFGTDSSCFSRILERKDETIYDYYFAWYS